MQSKANETAAARRPEGAEAGLFAQTGRPGGPREDDEGAPGSSGGGWNRQEREEESEEQPDRYAPPIIIPDIEGSLPGHEDFPEGGPRRPRPRPY